MFSLVDLPRLTGLHIQTQTGVTTLSWELPSGFYTGLAVEKCRIIKDGCQLHSMEVNSTSLQVEGGMEMYIYRLLVYQHGQQVVAEQFIDGEAVHGVQSILLRAVN